ncbi:MAG TPA: M43 family zinc metalloprotease, partial [Flavobacteriales bacterium]|nr:M43 family zinc metalloprotease [Flavobacteriales bacterium]
DVEIEFRLAQIDPYGNCTNGIDRIQTLRTDEGDDGSKLDPWFRERYLNVWVVNTIGDEDVAGYAYYPSAVEGPLAIADGIIILSDYIGRIGTGSENNSRALTHEIGHWLNLQHPWGNNNDPGVACGDDLVEDTPITKGWNHCPSLIAPDTADVCTDGVIENFQNYMDYSYCSVMFTNDQRTRMRNAVKSPIASRSNLWTDANRLLTGTEDGHVTQCAPRADFYCYTESQDGTNVFPMVCSGVDVHFRDNSGAADPTSWSWSFPGGNPSTSTDENPVVTYGAPFGHFEASLTVTNQYGSSSVTKYNVVVVSPTYSDVNGLLQEPFNDLASGNLWPVLNYENNQTKWAWNGVAGHNSPGSFRMNGSETVDPMEIIGDAVGDIDELATPTMDLTHLSNGTLHFWYAASSMASNTTDVTESLKIYSSSDCGTNWQLRKTVDSPEIITGGTTGSGYIPIAGDWREVSVPISPVLETDNVRFKFTYTAGRFSNDLFLDDVNIDGTVGIDELDANNGFLGLMPNPTDGQLSVEIDLAGSSTGTLS